MLEDGSQEHLKGNKLPSLQMTVGDQTSGIRMPFLVLHGPNIAFQRECFEKSPYRLPYIFPFFSLRIDYYIRTRTSCRFVFCSFCTLYQNWKKIKYHFEWLFQLCTFISIRHEVITSINLANSAKLKLKSRLNVDNKNMCFLQISWSVNIRSPLHWS